MKGYFENPKNMPQNVTNTYYQTIYTKHHSTVLVFKNNPSAIEQFEFVESVWLFNTSKHIQNQTSKSVFTFILTDSLQKKTLAFFHLFVENQTGYSPLRASFGSFEIVEDISTQAFDYLLKIINHTAIQQQLSEITIKHYPSCYNPSKSAFIKSGLLRNGFGYDKTFVNQHITVTQQSFEVGLHHSEKRRLRKCQKANFEFEEWQNPDANAIYEFIAKNRQQLGYTITFSLAELSNWFNVFSDYFQVFCVRDNNQIAALALTVRVGDDVLYNFCPANNLDYRTFSPAVILTKGLYDYCFNNQIQVLDLGISLDSNGNYKQSLSKFKQNLGADMSEKIAYKASYR
jgi:hypothetical protein